MLIDFRRNWDANGGCKPVPTQIVFACILQYQVELVKKRQRNLTNLPKIQQLKRLQQQQVKHKILKVKSIGILCFELTVVLHFNVAKYEKVKFDAL